jgi:16S rRNA G966 N2-methylase RsmD
MNTTRYTKYISLLPSNFNYDEEGLWSLSLPNDANKISKIILNEFGKNIVILDGTAGLGGNVISFCNYFSYVFGIEINNNRYKLLKNNIEQNKLLNIEIINNNSLELIIENYFDKNINCYFFDPPWGGPNYKKFKNIKLKLGDYSLINLINIIKNINKKKSIIFKLPNNYDLEEFNNFNYKIFKIKNYLLLIIY